MEADAKLRMGVYQEGQRAFRTGAPCPYADWRAKTWERGHAAAQAHAEEFVSKIPVVSCGICGKPTRMLGTKRCDGCWELETRIHRDPELARQILDGMSRG